MLKIQHTLSFTLSHLPFFHINPQICYFYCTTNFLKHLKNSQRKQNEYKQIIIVSPWKYILPREWAALGDALFLL